MLYYTHIYSIMPPVLDQNDLRLCLELAPRCVAEACPAFVNLSELLLAGGGPGAPRSRRPAVQAPPR